MQLTSCHLKVDAKTNCMLTVWTMSLLCEMSKFNGSSLLAMLHTNHEGFICFTWQSALLDAALPRIGCCKLVFQPNCRAKHQTELTTELCSWAPWCLLVVVWWQTLLNKQTNPKAMFAPQMMSFVEVLTVVWQLLVHFACNCLTSILCGLVAQLHLLLRISCCLIPHLKSFSASFQIWPVWQTSPISFFVVHLSSQTCFWSFWHAVHPFIPKVTFLSPQWQRRKQDQTCFSCISWPICCFNFSTNHSWLISDKLLACCSFFMFSLLRISSAPTAAWFQGCHKSWQKDSTLASHLSTEENQPIPVLILTAFQPVTVDHPACQLWQKTNNQFFFPSIWMKKKSWFSVEKFSFPFSCLCLWGEGIMEMHNPLLNTELRSAWTQQMIIDLGCCNLNPANETRWLGNQPNLTQSIERTCNKTENQFWHSCHPSWLIWNSQCIWPFVVSHLVKNVTALLMEMHRASIHPLHHTILKHQKETCAILPVIRPESRWRFPSFRHELVRKPACVTSWKPFCDLLWSCTLSSMLCGIPLGSPGADNEQRRQSWWLWRKEAVIWILLRRLVVRSSANCGSELSKTSSWFCGDLIICDQNIPQFDFFQVSCLRHSQAIALVKHCSWKLQTKTNKIADNCAAVDELLVTQWAHFRLTVASVLLVKMATAAGRGPGPVLAESQLDALRLLTAIMRKLEISGADIDDHPILLTPRKSAILRWNGDFIFLTADAINKLTCDDPGAGVEVNLETAHKSQLWVLLSCWHKLSHKKWGGIATNAPSRTLAKFKAFWATSCDPTQPIVPWRKMTAKSEGPSNWNKSIKPDARDFKLFGEMNSWIECKETSFLIAPEAQNLAHLVEKNPMIHGNDFVSAQRKFPFKVMKDDFLRHEAKSIVKKHTEDKDTRRIWEELCDFHGSLIAAAMHADVLMTHLTDVELHKANWNRGQGKFINHCKIQKNKFHDLWPSCRADVTQRRQRNPKLGTSTWSAQASKEGSWFDDQHFIRRVLCSAVRTGSSTWQCQHPCEEQMSKKGWCPRLDWRQNGMRSDCSQSRWPWRSGAWPQQNPRSWCQRSAWQRIWSMCPKKTRRNEQPEMSSWPDAGETCPCDPRHLEFHSKGWPSEMGLSPTRPSWLSLLVTLTRVKSACHETQKSTRWRPVNMAWRGWKFSHRGEESRSNTTSSWWRWHDGQVVWRTRCWFWTDPPSQKGQHTPFHRSPQNGTRRRIRRWCENARKSSLKAAVMWVRNAAAVMMPCRESATLQKPQRCETANCSWMKALKTKNHEIMNMLDFAAVKAVIQSRFDETELAWFCEADNTNMTHWNETRLLWCWSLMDPLNNFDANAKAKINTRWFEAWMLHHRFMNVEEMFPENFPGAQNLHNVQRLWQTSTQWQSRKERRVDHANEHHWGIRDNMQCQVQQCKKHANWRHEATIQTEISKGLWQSQNIDIKVKAHPEKCSQMNFNNENITCSLKKDNITRHVGNIGTFIPQSWHEDLPQQTKKKSNQQSKLWVRDLFRFSQHLSVTNLSLFPCRTTTWNTRNNNWSVDWAGHNVILMNIVCLCFSPGCTVMLQQTPKEAKQKTTILMFVRQAAWRNCSFRRQTKAAGLLIAASRSRHHSCFIGQNSLTALEKMWHWRLSGWS